MRLKAELSICYLVNHSQIISIQKQLGVDTSVPRSSTFLLLLVQAKPTILIAESLRGDWLLKEGQVSWKAAGGRKAGKAGARQGKLHYRVAQKLLLLLLSKPGTLPTPPCPPTQKYPSAVCRYTAHRMWPEDTWKMLKRLTDDGPLCIAHPHRGDKSTQVVPKRNPRGGQKLQL